MTQPTNKKQAAKLDPKNTLGQNWNWTSEKERIQQRIDNGSSMPSEPGVLELDDIELIPEVFQHRSGNHAASRQHVQVLTKSLKSSKGEPFDPLTVFWIGDAWCLIDGHHRQEAYKALEHSKPVPVKVFTGTLDEALGEALKGNSKDKLSMGASEKSNAAWRLVVGTALSINETAAASLRSRASIITMRNTAKDLHKAYPELDLGTLRWEEARKLSKGLALDEIEYDDAWLEAQAQELANRMTSKLGNQLGSQPDVLWRALEIYDARLVDWFLEQHGIESEDDNEVDEESVPF